MRFAPLNSIPCYLFQVDLMNSCNGLLCLTDSKRDGSLYVCNPILGSTTGVSPAAHIYTIGTGVWRSLGKPPRGGPIPFDSFLHGALHWIPYASYNYTPQSIRSFDFEREEFRPLPLPPVSLKKSSQYDGFGLGVLKEGEEVKRIRDKHQAYNILLGRGSSDSACSSVPPNHKSKKLN
ncbi:hypothetical protein ACLB2K_006884 [Fragaria x ananassa]